MEGIRRIRRLETGEVVQTGALQAHQEVASGAAVYDDLPAPEVETAAFAPPVREELHKPRFRKPGGAEKRPSADAAPETGDEEGA